MACYGRSYVDTTNGIELSARDVPHARVRRNSCPALIHRWYDQSIIDNDNGNGHAITTFNNAIGHVRPRSLSGHAVLAKSDFSLYPIEDFGLIDWYEDVESERNDLCAIADDLSKRVQTVDDGTPENSDNELSGFVYETYLRDTKLSKSIQDDANDRNDRPTVLPNTMVIDDHSDTINELQSHYDFSDLELCSQSDFDSEKNEIEVHLFQRTTVLGIDRIFDNTGDCISDPLSNVKRKVKLTMYDDDKIDQYRTYLLHNRNHPSEYSESHSSEYDTESNYSINTAADIESNLPIKFKSNGSSKFKLSSRCKRFIISKMLNNVNTIRKNKINWLTDTVSAIMLFNASRGNFNETSLFSIFGIVFSLVRLSTRLTTVLIKSTSRSDSSWSAVQTLIGKTFEDSDVKPFIDSDGRVRWQVVPCIECNA